MQTYTVTLQPDSWVEILGGEASMGIDAGSASPIALHMSHSASAPAVDAPFVRVETWPHGFDFYAAGMALGQYVWARSLGGPCNVVVVR